MIGKCGQVTEGRSGTCRVVQLRGENCLSSQQVREMAGRPEPQQ